MCLLWGKETRFRAIKGVGVWVGGVGWVWSCVSVVRWGLVCGDDWWDRCDCIGVSEVGCMRYICGGIKVH